MRTRTAPPPRNPCARRPRGALAFAAARDGVLVGALDPVARPKQVGTIIPGATSSRSRTPPPRPSRSRPNTASTPTRPSTARLAASPLACPTTRPPRSTTTRLCAAWSPTASSTSPTKRCRRASCASRPAPPATSTAPFHCSVPQTTHSIRLFTSAPSVATQNGTANVNGTRQASDASASAPSWLMIVSNVPTISAITSDRRSSGPYRSAHHRSRPPPSEKAHRPASGLPQRAHAVGSSVVRGPR